MQVSVNKADVIWSYIGTFMGLFSNILVVPFVVYYLNTEMLGLWYVFVSIGGLAHLFDFGFTITFGRNITYCWSGAKKLKKTGAEFSDNNQPDFRLMKNILNTCKKIYFFISLSVLVLMLTIGTYYVLSVSGNISGYKHILAYVIYAIGSFFNLYFSYYDSFLRGVGAVKEANKNKVIARIIQMASMVILLVCGFGILGLAITFFVYGFVFRWLASRKFYAYKNIGLHLKEIKEDISFSESKSLFKTIWYNAWREGLIQISQFCNTQVSVIICSLYFSLSETGIYSLGVQIGTAVTTLAAVLYGTYQPSLQNAYVKHDFELVRKYMSMIVCIFTITFIVGVLGTVFLGLPILKLIKPESIVSIPVLLGIFVNMYLLKFRDCYTSYFSCTNRIIYVWAFLVASILSIILSYVFLSVFDWGIWGLISAQILSQIIFNSWYWAVKCHKELNLNFCTTILYAHEMISKKIFKK